MKKLLVLAIMALSSLSALAYDAKIDGIYYNFSGNEAEVTYRHFSDCSYSGSVVIPQSVTYDSIDYTVTSIGQSAFYGSSSLTSVTIPNSVTGIGRDAFSGCGSLTSVTIPNSVTSIGIQAFYGCSGLISITIPGSVTSIDYAFFYNCTSLTSVAIGNGVTKIGRYAFYGCSGLSSIIIPEGVTEIDGSAFEGCSSLNTVTLPNSLTMIGGMTFKDCRALTSIVIPESVMGIGVSAFAGCSALTSINIPNNMAKIYSNTFSGCYSLTSISIPNNITRIDNNAFTGCYFAKDSLINNTSLEDSNNWGAIVCDEETNEGLLIKDKTIMKCRCWATSVTIPNSIISIESDAFIGCCELSSIIVENENKQYDSRNECNAIIRTATNTLVLGCKNTIIPENVTRIDCNAFRDCKAITSFCIPNCVTSIGNSAYQGCSGLTSITIPNSVTDIGDYAFYGCSNLTSISIPNDVTNIGDYTFYGCSSLTSIFIPNNVTSIGGNAFQGCSNLISVSIPNKVTYIGKNAFQDCKIRNMLIKCANPPSSNSAFSEQIYYHTTLYIPTGSWDAYAYDDYWYKFINIRETAMAEEDVSEQQAYMLMDAETFAYSVYDPVNDCIGTINSIGSINEDNPYHSWQMIRADGMHFLYNLGAKKYVKRDADALSLTDEPEPIDIANGDNGLILAGQSGKRCVLVCNESLSFSQAAIDQVTGIDSLTPSLSKGEGEIYNLAGQLMSKPQKGISIIGGRKVLVK